MSNKQDLSKVRLTSLDGEITPQGMQICIAFARAVKAGNMLRQQVLVSIVKNRYRQPSFLPMFNEIRNDRRLCDDYAGGGQ